MTRLRRHRSPLIAGLVLAGLAAGVLARGRPLSPAAAQPAAQAATLTLSVVGTNDLHGGIGARDGRGGLALFGGYVANLREARRRDGGAVVLVDGGDLFQGTLESNLNEGTAVIAAYNLLGYAAAAVGNHEFDFGPAGPDATPVRPGDDPRGALKARAAEAHFPLLAANVIETATGRPVAWPNVQPSAIVAAGGVRVGIVGVTTADTLRATIASNTRGLSIAPLPATVVEQARRVRAQGATVVIVAAHAGGRCTEFGHPDNLSSCDAATSEIVALARALPPALVDVIVAGHTHAGMAHEVQGVPIIEAFTGGRAFGRVDLTVDRGTGRPAAHRVFAPRDICARENAATHACVADGAAGGVPATYEGAPVAADAAIARAIAPAIEAARELKARLLGVVLDAPVRRAGRVESPLGNLFADAFLAWDPSADVALNNTAGGLRADWPAGPLTFGSLFETFPFDNRLVSLPLTGAELRKVLSAQLARNGDSLGVAGIRVEAACRQGRLDVSVVRPTGRAIADADRVKLVTTDFIAAGGDGLLTAVTPPQGFVVPDTAPLARDVVAAAMQRRGGHLTEDQLIDTGHPRWPYPGTPPLRCTN